MFCLIIFHKVSNKLINFHVDLDIWLLLWNPNVNRFQRNVYILNTKID